MLLPYGTDAPIYHRPIGTVLLMLVNIAVFVLFPSEMHEDWMMELGGGIHPLQWVSNIFMHAGLGHLIGNLIFLWSFGLIVEGKLGFLGFLATYLAIGTVASALVQFCIRPEEIGYALGASGAIYGLLALCLVWAPKNDLYCFVGYWGLMRALFPDGQVSILWFAGFYIGFEVFFASAKSLAPSSEVLHSSGAVVGLGVGFLLLKLDLVDCEGWDLLSVMGRNTGKSGKKKSRAGRSLAENVERRVKKRKKQPIAAKSAAEVAEFASQELRLHLDSGETEAALSVYKKNRRTSASWRPIDADRLELIKAVLAAGSYEDAAGLMQAHLNETPSPPLKLRLRLAEILIRKLQRPAAGLNILDQVSRSDRTGPLAEPYQKLVALGEHMREEGALELDAEVAAI